MVEILEAKSQQQFARRVGKKKLAENQRGDEAEIIDEMSEDEAAINDCPDPNEWIMFQFLDVQQFLLILLH